MEPRQDSAQPISGPHFKPPFSREDLQRLLQLAQNENIPFQRLAAAIDACPGVSSAILRAASAASLGAGREARSLTHAVSLLGLRRVQAILLDLQRTTDERRPVRIAG